MGMFHKVQVGNESISPIDWEMNPDISFGTFESWGGRERVRNNSERVYYFFIDNWGDSPKLCLMERGVKHAKIVAEIRAPKDLVHDCVKGQGTSSIFEKSYAINDKIQKWLIDNVLDGGDSSLVVPREEKIEVEDLCGKLPAYVKGERSQNPIVLPSESKFIAEDEIGELIARWNFFDSKLNPSGRFENDLAAWTQPDLIVDRRTSLLWQQGGRDINSIRRINAELEKFNAESAYGFDDWRLPTMEEALSLMEPVRNDKGVYLAPCFSREQPFIFVDAKRKPGGYWFVDYKQGRPFWSSGTIPGGFARFVRSLK